MNLRVRVDGLLEKGDSHEKDARDFRGFHLDQEVRAAVQDQPCRGCGWPDADRIHRKRNLEHGIMIDLVDLVSQIEQGWILDEEIPS